MAKVVEQDRVMRTAQLSVATAPPVVKTPATS